MAEHWFVPEFLLILFLHLFCSYIGETVPRIVLSDKLNSCTSVMAMSTSFEERTKL
jgi:hypothetical protein